MKQRILIVDDEATVRHTVRAYLEQEGFVVETAVNGQEALAAAQQAMPDLMILDIMLPSLDGLALLRQIRRDSAVYVLMLTAKTSEVDRIVGLELGADDYLTKPFSPRELVARVKAILRRGRQTAVADPVLTFQQLQFDPNAHRVLKNGVELDLTPIEYDLLYTLARHNGRVLSRDQLIEHVWGYDYFGDERVIDVHIRRIRRKVEDDPQNPTHIVTIRGVRYRFDGGHA